MSAENNKVLQSAWDAYHAGDLVRAEELLSEINKGGSVHPDVLHLRGIVYLDTGRHEKARDVLAEAVEKYPDFAHAWLNLGLSQTRLSNFDDAVESIGQACAISPELQEHGDYLLANAYLESGKPGEAIAYIESALKKSDDNPYYHKLYADLLRNKGHITESIVHYEHALKSYPEYRDAAHNFALMLFQEGYFNKAFKTVNLVLGLDPDNIEMLATKAKIFSERMEYGKAQRSISRALGIIDEKYGKGAETGGLTAMVLYVQGLVSGKIGNYEAAKKSMEQAVSFASDEEQKNSILPELAKLYFESGEKDRATDLFQQISEMGSPMDCIGLMGLGDILTSAGDIDAAKDVLYSALERCDQGHDYNRLQIYSKLTQLGAYKDDESILLNLESMANQTESRTGFATAHYAIAKIHEYKEEYEKSLHSLKIANQIDRQQFAYDNKGYISRMTTVNYEKKDYFMNNESAVHKDPIPVFILGMPRSGTTLLEQVLVSHSKVSFAGELDYLRKSAVSILTCPEVDISSNLSGISYDQAKNIRQAYLDKIKSLGQGTRYVVDKMPDNFKWLGLISLCFPEAKIVHAYRYPADTCLSIYKNAFSAGHKYSFDLEEIGEYYNAYMDLMRTWRELDLSFHEVAYEDMVSNTEQTVRALLAYCGLEWEDACLEFYKSKELVRTVSKVQVRQPVYTKSVGLWERYGEGMKVLNEILKPSVESYHALRKQ